MQSHAMQRDCSFINAQLRSCCIILTAVLNASSEVPDVKASAYGASPLLSTIGNRICVQSLWQSHRFRLFFSARRRRRMMAARTGGNSMWLTCTAVVMARVWRGWGRNGGICILTSLISWSIAAFERVQSASFDVVVVICQQPQQPCRRRRN